MFPLSHLEAFYEDEIEALLCGSGEAWSVAGLAKAMKFDHGYTPASPVIVALLEVLSELDSLDQRRFLRFVTGIFASPACILETRIVFMYHGCYDWHSVLTRVCLCGSCQVFGDFSIGVSEFAMLQLPAACQLSSVKR